MAQLGASIEEDAAAVETMRVDEDQRLSAGMRTAGKRAEQEVSAATEAQAAKVNSPPAGRAALAAGIGLGCRELVMGLLRVVRGILLLNFLFWGADDVASGRS